MRVFLASTVRTDLTRMPPKRCATKYNQNHNSFRTPVSTLLTISTERLGCWSPCERPRKQRTGFPTPLPTKPSRKRIGCGLMLPPRFSRHRRVIPIRFTYVSLLELPGARAARVLTLDSSMIWDNDRFKPDVSRWQKTATLETFFSPPFRHTPDAPSLVALTLL